MAARSFEASFVTTLPLSRAREAIVADLGAGTSGSASDASSAAIAEIELLIHDGNRLYQQGRDVAARECFEKARASVYRLMHPWFDVPYYMASVRPILPGSAEIEQRLLSTAGTIVAATRPSTARPSKFWTTTMAAEPVPETLKAFAELGVRETGSDEQLLPAAAEHGVALIKDGRPEKGVEIFDAALASASTGADPAQIGALRLNRAVALVQMGEARAAVQSARAAIDSFAQVGDTAGVAQAFHAAAVSLQLAGDPNGAGEMFARAAEAVSGLGVNGQRPVVEKAAATAAATLPLTVSLNSAAISSSSAATIRALSPRLSEAVTRDPAALQPILQRDAQTLTFRLPGRGDGWGTMPVVGASERAQQVKPWSLGVTAAGQAVTFALGNDQRLSSGDVAAKLYDPRRAATTIEGLQWAIGGTHATTVYLNHLYSYVLPLAIGDCYQAHRQFAKAEEYYLLAAQYGFLNAEIEATALWVRLAMNAWAWGDSLYREEDLAGATVQYSKIVMTDGTVPASPLYDLPALAVPAATATGILALLDTRPLPFDHWEIELPILSAFAQLQLIAAGFDFFGLLLAPIHTFDYLQSVAQGFAREAIQAESQFVNFKTRQQADEAARRELETARAMAEAEAQARAQLYLSAVADENAAKQAKALALERFTDAKKLLEEYKVTSAEDLWARVASQALSGGQDAFPAEIAELADKLDRGETIEGKGPKLAAAFLYFAGRKTQQYELEKMQFNVDELETGTKVAADQVTAATARKRSAELSWQAAQSRARLAVEALAAFDKQLFTPDAWAKMANVMRDIAQGYLFRAIRIAKLMERAYNFEQDASQTIIKNEYGVALTNPGAAGTPSVLGGDLLLQDIESFTYAAITSRTGKACRIKDVLSIASTFPAEFDAFRRTGRLTVETDLYEFDRLHPGFFGQRLHAVELEVIGLLPESGLNGTFTAGGVTSFRRRDGSVGKRVQIVDSMALSQYTTRTDGLLYIPEVGIKGLFQGFGLGTTWQLHLPRRSNDLDLNRIFDVRLLLYYSAEYDDALAARVLAAPVRPGELTQLRDFGLRYDFPDAWYGFYADGIARIQLERLRLPMNQTNFRTRVVNTRVIAKPGVAAGGLEVKITAPSGAAGTGTTNANGVLTTADPALAALINVDPVGLWQVQVVGGPSIANGGAPHFERIYNIQLGFDYSFDYVAEEV